MDIDNIKKLFKLLVMNNKKKEKHFAIKSRKIKSMEKNKE